MEVREALERIKQYLAESPALRKLRPDTNEYKLWKSKVEDVLRAAFGEESLEYKDFTRKRQRQYAPIRTLTFDQDNQNHDEAQQVQEYLKDIEQNELEIKKIIQRYEDIGIEPESPAKDSLETANHLFNRMQFHPKVVEVSKSLFETGHYAQAIFDTFKAVNNFVKERSGSDLDGKKLMAQVFDEKHPIIRLNECKTQSDKDEQEGFKFLFMGAMVGIRNPKAHDNVTQTDPYRTLEYLALASLLMRRIEEGTVISRPSEQDKHVQTI